MLDRLKAWVRALWDDPSVRVGSAAFLVLRIVTAAWAIAARSLYPGPFVPDPVLRPYLGVAIETNPILEPWQRWDTLHYQAIAERGYAAFDTALFTPPLYPGLMGLVGSALGGHTLAAGILLSNLACLLGLIALARLAVLETGDIPSARRTVLYAASFPAAFFLVAAYTESLFLLCAVLTLLHARREEWLRAGVWAAVASLTRLPGALVLLPLAYQAWQARRGARQWVGVGIGIAGALAFPMYVWMVLRLPPWQPLIEQGARFGGGLAFPGWNLVQAVRQIVQGDFYLADVLDVAALLLFLASAIPICCWLPRVYAVYTLAFLALYLVRAGGAEPLLGTTRYVLALFPSLIWLGSVGKSPWVHRLILYPSWVGLLFLSGQFAVWGWVG